MYQVVEKEAFNGKEVPINRERVPGIGNESVGRDRAQNKSSNSNNNSGGRWKTVDEGFSAGGNAAPPKAADRDFPVDLLHTIKRTNF